MIDAKTAVAAVSEYIKSFPDLLQLSSPRLEETETEGEGGDWLITISAIDDPDLSISLGTPPHRSYRQFRVREVKGFDRGEVVSMKVRNFAFE